MKLHNKKSFIHAAPQSPPPKKRTPKITQWLYIAFLLAISAYIIFVLIKQAVTLQAPGLIEVDRIAVKSPYAGVLTSFDIAYDQSIQQGDILAVISPDKPCEPIDNSKDERALRYRIQDAQLALQLLEDEHRIDQREYERLLAEDRKLKRALEINAPLNTDSDKLRITLAKQNAEINIERTKINALKSRYEELVKRNQPILPEQCRPHSVSAESNGRVISIAVQQNEVVKIGDTLFSILPEQANVGLSVFLNKSDFNDLAIGEELTVIFPDDSTSVGVITRIASAASTQSDLQFDDYQPVLPQIKVHLEPVNKKAAMKWAQFDRFQVQVEGVH